MAVGGNHTVNECVPPLLDMLINYGTAAESSQEADRPQQEFRAKGKGQRAKLTFKYPVSIQGPAHL